MESFEPIVLKNVLDETAFDNLRRHLLSNKKIYWNFFEIPSPILCHYVIKDSKVVTNDDNYNIIAQFIDHLSSFFNKKLYFTRICICFLLQDTELIGDPKTDITIQEESDKYRFYTGMFYMDDANCHTCDTLFIDNSDITIGKFAPLRNSMIVFDTRQRHKTLSCSMRIAIMFNFYFEK